MTEEMCDWEAISLNVLPKINFYDVIPFAS